MSDYTNESQQRLLNILSTLFGHEVTGISAADIIKATGNKNANVTRDLFNLEKAGFAQRLPSGNWRVSERLGRQAMVMLNHIEHQQKMLDRARNRLTV